ncbi:MAG TPA: hypothetical protein IAB23_08540 [Candidatus Scybalocola faecavium]|nr:hypothetical protein [Candidatus Scybalocola faecavium]
MKRTVRSLIDSKKPFIGTLMQFPSVELTEMFAYTGFDFLIMDMEHGLIENNDALAMVRACEIYDTAAMIRVPQVDEEKIKKALDMGASGILVAGVHSYEDAVNAVKYAKFKPMGIRGACPAVRANHFGLDDHVSYYEKQNKETVLFVALEGPEVVKDIDRIAQIQGIDIIGVGPVDMALALGVPGQIDAPVVQEAIAKVKTTANANGKLYASFANHIKDFIDSHEPADFYMVAGDTWLIGDMLLQVGKELNELRSKQN